MKKKTFYLSRLKQVIPCEIDSFLIILIIIEIKISYGEDLRRIQKYPDDENVHISNGMAPINDNVLSIPVIAHDLCKALGHFLNASSPPTTRPSNATSIPNL